MYDHRIEEKSVLKYKFQDSNVFIIIKVNKILRVSVNKGEMCVPWISSLLFEIKEKIRNQETEREEPVQQEEKQECALFWKPGQGEKRITCC